MCFQTFLILLLQPGMGHQWQAAVFSDLCGPADVVESPFVELDASGPAEVEVVVESLPSRRGPADMDVEVVEE